MCYLTDYGDYAPERLARLYRRGRLHVVDQFFMQLRRGVSPLAPSRRQVPHAVFGMDTALTTRRLWSSYREIYRVYCNYVQIGEDDRAPAMRLGLVTEPVRSTTCWPMCRGQAQGRRLNMQPEVTNCDGTRIVFVVRIWPVALMRRKIHARLHSR